MPYRTPWAHWPSSRRRVGILLSALATSALGVVALMSVAMVVDPPVALSVVAIGALLFGALRPFNLLVRRESRHFVGTNSAFCERVAQWSTLAMELRVFGVTDVERDRLGVENRDVAGAFARSRLLSRFGGDLYRDVAVLLLVGAMGAVYLVSSIDAAAVGAVVLLIVRCSSYAQRASVAFQQIGELEPNLERLTERIESMAAAADSSGARAVSTLTRLELVDVGYDYGPGRPGVDGVTLTIDAGEVIGVVGPSGAGKSTLVQLLLRLRVPSRGTITVSGIPYEEIEPSSWHRLVALVPQDPKLFEGTVHDNIAFHRPGITREQVEAAAVAAHVAGDIRELPLGFDTLLGPRGTGLSGGQKQRVTIARALVGEPQLLVLDEPTSALDARSERLLLQTIEELEGRVTMVIIAHRLTTLARCDRLIGMDHGHLKIVDAFEAEAAIAFDHASAGGSPRRR